MNPKQFFDTVCMMRNAQKDYFKTRAAGSLAEAKRLEKLIDNEIAGLRKLTVMNHLYLKIVAYDNVSCRRGRWLHAGRAEFYLSFL